MGRKHEDDEQAPERPSRWRGLPLQDREEVILSVTPSRAANFYKYVYTLGLYELWRRRDRATVTDRRLLIGRGIVHREEHSIAMSHIDGARYVRMGLNAYAQVSINDRGRRRTERIGPMSAREARAFVAEILARQ
jgi:hypothetical protein